MSARRRSLSNTESVDNYPKAIFSLGAQTDVRVSTKVLAERLCVAPASVTNMPAEARGGNGFAGGV